MTKANLSGANLSIAEYRKHNAKRPKRSKRTQCVLRDETTVILNHIERVATLRGLM